MPNSLARGERRLDVLAVEVAEVGPVQQPGEVAQQRPLSRCCFCSAFSGSARPARRCRGAPDITQEHEHETSQIEDEFFYRYGAAARGDIDAESGGLVWEHEEGVAEKQVEEKADWRQDGDRTPKGRARKLKVGPGSKPPRQGCDRNEEEEQTPGVTKWRRIVGAWL